MSRSQKHRFDYAEGDVVGAVRSRLRALAPLRSAFIEIASFLAAHENSLGFVLLTDPGVSAARLEQEWQNIAKIVRPEIARRISLFNYTAGAYQGWPPDRVPELRSHLDRVLVGASTSTGIKLPRADYFTIILKMLLEHRLSGTPAMPLTAKLIGKLAGCSFPTVKSALDQLKHVLRKSPVGGVELKRFPAQEWQALILGADRSRATRRYQDRSGKPRSPAFLIERLARLQREDIAIGGVVAALDFYPELDLVGNPRLDLCIHTPGKHTDLSFIEALDPALQETKDAQAPVSLALHFVRSQESFFTHFNNGLKRAGVVECLLDLYELRLPDQANDWMNALLKHERES